MEEQCKSQAQSLEDGGHEKNSEQNSSHAAHQGVSNNENASTLRRRPSLIVNCVARFRQTWPRTFHLLVRVLIPLLFLIGVCFLCGYFLARMESSVEIAANDALLAESFHLTLQISSVAYGNYIPSPCIADWNVNDPNFNATGLRDFLDDCQQDLVRQKELDEQQGGELTFDWIICNGETPYVEQYEHVLYAWTDDYYRLTEKYATEDNLTFQDASDLALHEATGHDDCSLHTAAGALFWFTILTTVGYGNTSPSSAGGRAMIYTLGFLSIILFGAVIGWASHIVLVIFEDLMLRCNLRLFTRGMLAPLFWLSVLALWLLVLAGISVGAKGTSEANIDLADAYWFSYITITTVGLGDIYFSPETFRVSDVFAVSFLSLLGFVVMGNFLYKLAEWLRDAIPVHGEPLEQVLESSRVSFRRNKKRHDKYSTRTQPAVDKS